MEDRAVSLKALGVSGITLAWFQSYSTSCFQRTFIDQSSCCTRLVSVGALQGLGGILISKGHGCSLEILNRTPECCKDPFLGAFGLNTFWILRCTFSKTTHCLLPYVFLLSTLKCTTTNQHLFALHYKVQVPQYNWSPKIAIKLN